MVNLRDFSGLRACMGWRSVKTASVCGPFDLNDDRDCDMLDYAIMAQAFTGEPVVPATGDFDGDGHVTLTDYAAYFDCRTAPGPISQGGACEVFDFDFDLDVDLQDFGRLQRLFGN